MNNIDKALYELFASKKLTVGCKIEIIKNPWDWHYFYAVTEIGSNYFYAQNLDWNHWDEDIYFDKNQEYIILWHEPTITDIFIVAKEKEITLYLDNHLNSIWAYSKKIEKVIPYNPTLSLMNQTDSTKQAIINLFK